MGRPRNFDETAALDAAVETFRSRSYAGTSTDDLCRATGLSRSSLYNTFDCKADLYRRCMTRYGDQKELDRRAALEGPGSGRELLEQLLAETLADQRATPDLRGCLVINAAVEIGPSEADIARMARDNLRAFQELLASLIRRGQEDGSIADDATPDELAAVVHAAINGLQVSARVDGDPAAGPRAVRALMALLRPR
ncbi:TetR/AcrR family transcriptional regulator [Tsukamurella sp. 8F]|uniref:TetR/AcrR family transcriptional regulator n=1 Tax=unclassified Tsukamurella TaxID=2633480 RepID=UPI0023B8AF72|nr:MULTISPECIES: TetR/AcrR family transcriptional regulator [unclassified Tsukamurella]MDF0531844.1 TetR/AcrR family transcriptional regulator [Tsukamurella sp. 8J]MDF0589078.1 TetR/AcrR family transcriptional regulator [Tsukamurella sp. 8F]